MDLILLLTILLFGFLLRMSFGTAESTDEWVSFWLIQRQKESNWVNYNVDDSIVDGTYCYPVLQHFIVSRFPERYWSSIGYIFNTLYDILTALCVYLVAYLLSRDLHIYIKIGGLETEEVATLLFLTTPVLFPATSRMITIKARSIGLTLTTMFLLLVGVGMINNDWRCYAVSVVVGLLIILSSMFALQVMIFFTIFLSIYMKSPHPIIVLFIVLSIAYLMPRFGTKEVLRFMWHHKLWYMRNYTKGTTAAGRNKIKDIVLLPIYAIKDFKKFSMLCFKQITPIIALYSAPTVFILLGMWIIQAPSWQLVSSSPALSYLWGIVLASLVIFILTSFKQLSFLGQAERYFEYSSPAFSIMAVFLLSSFSDTTRSNLFWFLFLFQLSVVYITSLYLKYEGIIQTKSNISQDLQQVIDWCTGNLDHARLSTVPCKLGFILSTSMNRMAAGRFKFYYKFILRGGEKGFKYYEDDTGGCVKTHNGWIQSKEVFRISPSELSSKYGVTHLLIDKKYLEGLYRSWAGQDIDLLGSPLFQNQGYIVYSII